MSDRFGNLYRLMRGLIGLALGFYFRRIERFHPERVPLTGPVLFTSNHPNSLTDSFVVGSAIPRKVNFVATVQLFRLPALKWLLTQCGVIPINRVRDDARAMRTVAETFEACFRVLEAGETVGIFPEGVTYEDSQLREVKSGAARMALELEHRHGGKLGLRIAPVGLSYSAKEKYRSDVLVHFGEPIIVSEFLEGYAERRKECIHRLTAEIERRLQGLILHLPKLELGRIVEGVKGLYLDKLLVGPGIIREPAEGRAGELLVAQTIAAGVEQMHQIDPERVEAFGRKLHAYEEGLNRLRISGDYLSWFPDGSAMVRKTLLWALVAILGLPLAIYGWVHRLIPWMMVQYAATHFTEREKRKAQASTAKITAGIVVFTVCYALYAAGFYALFGWPAVLWYALSLPLASMVAHYFAVHLMRLAESLRTAVILARVPSAARRLRRLREELTQEIEAVRPEVRQALAKLPSAAQAGAGWAVSALLVLAVLFTSTSWAAEPVTKLKRDQEILFYPGLATRSADGGNWEVEISGCVFEPAPPKVSLALLKEALELKGVAMNEAEAAVFKERVRWFLLDHERGKSVVAKLGTNTVKLAKSGPDGRFDGRVSLSRGQMTQWMRSAGNSPQAVHFSAVLPEEDPRQFGGTVHLFEESGITVVSDIDDTIKLSFIGDRDKLLRATFLEPMKAVPGMPELYRHWQGQLPQLNICYLSASPWQLYEPLALFVRSNGFPEGPFFLKTFRWKNRTFFSLFQSPEKYKPAVLESMLKRFPRRQFFLVGDSGERDPEIYGAFARKHPGRVRAILIRDTSGKGGLEERMERAFQGLAPGIGRVFREPSEVLEVLR